MTSRRGASRGTKRVGPASRRRVVNVNAHITFSDGDVTDETLPN